ncbi:MAG: hypothetical protein IIB38_16215, partial [Candidatus Hydrogenedentes bacterium]|nr:hypothetical protein [Candidatus Hydrogenedentota bacterium]
MTWIYIIIGTAIGTVIIGFIPAIRGFIVDGVKLWLEFRRDRTQQKNRREDIRRNDRPYLLKIQETLSLRVNQPETMLLYGAEIAETCIRNAEKLKAPEHDDVHPLATEMKTSITEGRSTNDFVPAAKRL